MTDFVKYVIEGVPLGCVFALVAIGLVLTYKTSGVFNLAFGAQAYVAAVLFYELRVRNDWATLPAFVVVVLVASPLMGLLLEVLIFRHLRTAPPLAKLVSSLGLLVAVPQFVSILLGTGSDVRRQGHLVERRRPVQVRRLRARRQGDGRHREHAGGRRAARRALPVRADRAADARRGREPAHDRARRASTPTASRRSRGCSRASSPDSRACCSRRCTRRSRRRTSRPCSSPRSRRPRSPGSPASRSRCSAGSSWVSRRRCSPGTSHPRACSRRTSARRCRSPRLFLLLLFWPGLRTAAASKDPLSGVDPPPMAPVAATRSPFLTIATRVFGLIGGRRRARPRDDDVQRAVGQHLHDRGDLLGDPPLDHRHHRDGGGDLARPGDVRGHRRVRAPRSSCRSSGSRCSRRCSSARSLAALVGRDRRGPAPAARWHLPVARHVGDRAGVRDA